MISLKEMMTPINECLHPENTLYEAIELMKKNKWNTVPVSDQKGILVGVFTRSILYQMLLSGKDLSDIIRDYVIKSVNTVSDDMSYEEVEHITLTSEVGTGVVTNAEGQPIGLITKQDFIMALLKKTHLLKEQLETILHSSQLGALMVNDKNIIIFVNDKLCEWLGESENEVLYKPLENVIPNVHLLETDSETHHRIQFKNHHFMVRLSKHKMVTGEYRVIALFQNISELEKMAHELETVKRWKSILQTVINNSYDGLIMINEKAETIFLSPSLIELFELQDKNIDREQINTILPHLDLTQALKTGVADISEFMEVKGINYIVHRIPVYQEDQLIGAIGKVVFRQLLEVRERFRRYEVNEQKRNDGLQKPRSSRFKFNQIIFRDPQMEKLMRSVTKAAKGRSTILIRGESGTGKELFAHIVHDKSSRSEGPFITVNCAAIPESLLESEFFGYEEGAFTGAKQKGQMGKFEMANGGTLFLDEVGDMSVQLQAKLLRALQEREFYRVGGTKPIQVDVRIIAATHRSLEEMVEKEEFREDLFYRLNVISFEIPPLRNRKGDILQLSEYFIKELNKQNGTSIVGWNKDVEQVMMNYDWPGNIRELRNVLERAMVFAEFGKIQLDDLPDYLFKRLALDPINGEIGYESQSPLEKAEHAAILHALQEAKGNKTKAANILGISRSALYDRLKKYQQTANS